MVHQTDGVLIDQMSDLEVLYSRHQALFLILLGVDFIVSAIYIYIFVTQGLEVVGMKGNVKSLSDFYTALLVFQIGYTLLYFYWGLMACMGSPIQKHDYMGKFCVMAVIGMIMFIFAEYVRKFNLFIFFLRLVGKRVSLLKYCMHNIGKFRQLVYSLWVEVILSSLP